MSFLTFAEPKLHLSKKWSTSVWFTLMKVYKRGLHNNLKVSLPIALARFVLFVCFWLFVFLFVCLFCFCFLHYISSTWNYSVLINWGCRELSSKQFSKMYEYHVGLWNWSCDFISWMGLFPTCTGWRRPCLNFRALAKERNTHSKGGNWGVVY